MRDSGQLFNDLISMNADVWNTALADELGVSLDVLRAGISKKDMLVRDEDRLHMNIVKSKYVSGRDVSDDGEISKLNKYVIRLREKSNLPDSEICGLTCTGKLIVGMDFIDSDMSNSYFCDCVFYNCDFSNCNLESSVFNGCILNSCICGNTNFSGSTILKCMVIDTTFGGADFRVSIIMDSTIIGSQGLMCIFNEVRFTGVGFIDSVFSHSDFRGCGCILTSFTMTELNDANFSDSGLIDCMFVDVDLCGATFTDVFATCITSSRLKTNSRVLVDLFDSWSNAQIDKELLNADNDIADPDFDGGLEDSHA